MNEQVAHTLRDHACVVRCPLGSLTLDEHHERAAAPVANDIAAPTV